MNFPDNLLYTDDHEWISVPAGSNIGTIGITDYAQGELGDIVYVELPAVGKKLERGKSFGTIEAVKAVSDLFAPVDGEVMEVNSAVQEHPESVNKEPYGAGWLIRIKVTDAAQLSSLHTAEKYRTLVAK